MKRNQPFLLEKTLLNNILVTNKIINKSKMQKQKLLYNESSLWNDIWFSMMRLFTLYDETWIQWKVN